MYFSGHVPNQSYTIRILLIYQSDTIRIPSVYHPYTTRIPSVYQSYTIRIPPVYHPYTTRIPPTYHPYTTVYHQKPAVYHRIPPKTSRIPPYTAKNQPYTIRIPIVYQNVFYSLSCQISSCFAKPALQKSDPRKSTYWWFKKRAVGSFWSTSWGQPLRSKNPPSQFNPQKLYEPTAPKPFMNLRPDIFLWT